MSAAGWRFLTHHHGVEGLLEINRTSGWFDESDDAETLASLCYHCLSAGYDPTTDSFGRYEEESGTFTDRDGRSRAFPWQRLATEGIGIFP